jgi:hypothetical protein
MASPTASITAVCRSREIMQAVRARCRGSIVRMEARSASPWITPDTHNTPIASARCRRRRR